MSLMIFHYRLSQRCHLWYKLGLGVLCSDEIIFAELEPGFKDLEMTQAYQFNGYLKQGIFEAYLGTAAYQLDVVSIEKFVGKPDDFRTHQE